MSAKLLRRAFVVGTSALLVLMALGPSTAFASTPGWYFGTPTDPSTGTTIPSLNPAVVKVGANAAWSVTITNGGTSNISALYLSTDLPTKSALSYPTYIGNVTYGGGASGPSQPCNAAGTGPLFCSFGNLVAGGWVSIDVIAFQVGTPNSCVVGTSYTCYAFNFTAFGNGNTPSDKGNNSHGDTLLGPVSVNTTTSANFGGGFSIDTSDVSNSGVSRSNPQAESVTPPTNLIQVTVEDGLSCAVTWCSTGFGDVMRLNVDKGATYDTGIKLVINISGKSVPGGVTTSNMVLVHVLDDGTSYTISQRCDATTLPTVAGVECITVTKSGNNFQIVAWLVNNGGLRLQ